jgi:putative ABC transport system permease protein
MMTRVVRALALTAHRWLSILVLPSAFRREYGEEMEAIVRARLASRSGPLRVAKAGATELLDLVRAGPAEWRETRRSFKRGSGSMTGIWKDLGIACRSLIKRPILSLGVVLTIGLGIGATTTVFGVVDGVVLRPLPYANASRLAQIGTILPTDRTVDPRTGLQPLAPMTTTDFQGFVERNRSFEQVAATSPGRIVVRDGTGLETFVPIGNVTEGFFRLLGVSPALGRTFLPDEFTFPGDVDGLQQSVAILTYGYWQRRYGGDPDILGQPLEPAGTDDQAARSTIVGILPRGFQAPEALYGSADAPQIY